LLQPLLGEASIARECGLVDGSWWVQGTIGFELVDRAILT
jgi:hypothetical protein